VDGYAHVAKVLQFTPLVASNPVWMQNVLLRRSILFPVWVIIAQSAFS
jgi:hypothetical protein